MKKLLASGGPLGVFAEYPALLRLGIICVCAETAWATLLIVLEFYFNEELLHGFSKQLIASRVATTFLAFVGLETLFKYPMGRLADRYGPRPFVLLSLGICTVTPFLMYWVATRDPQWWHFMPMRALDGFAAASLWPAMSALMARAVPREAKAAAMSVFNAAYCLGLAVGPMAGLFIGHMADSNRYVFPFCGVIMGIGLVIALLSLHRIADEQQSSTHNALEKAPSLLKNRVLWRMMVLYGVSQIGMGILAPTVPLYIDSQFGIQQKDLSLAFIGPALLVALVAIPLGRLPDTIGRARAVWISYAMAMVGMFLCSITGWLPETKDLLSLPVVLFGSGMLLLVTSYILGTPAWLGLTSLQVSDRQQAQALSLMQTAQGVGVVIAFALVASAGQLLTQWKKVGERIDATLHHRAVEVLEKSQDTVPLSIWFWVSCAVFALCLVGTLLWVHEPKHDAHEEQLARDAEKPFADFSNTEDA